MKNLTHYFIICFSFCLIISCSPSSKDSVLPNERNDEFGNIAEFDSVLALRTPAQNMEASQSYYYKFQYNSNGLPVGKTGLVTPISSFPYNKFLNNIKDTLIYLNNNTIEKYTVNQNSVYGPQNKSLFYFSNGDLIKGIGYKDNIVHDSALFTYNSSHQLITSIQAYNTSDATKNLVIETNYSYIADSVKYYYFYKYNNSDQYYNPISKSPAQSKDQASAGKGYFLSDNKESNPFYHQSWLMIWNETFYLTLIKNKILD